MKTREYQGKSVINWGLIVTKLTNGGVKRIKRMARSIITTTIKGKNILTFSGRPEKGSIMNYRGGIKNEDKKAAKRFLLNRLIR